MNKVLHVQQEYGRTLFIIAAAQLSENIFELEGRLLAQAERVMD